MELHKNLGIWMDHEKAYLIDLHDKENLHTIVSNFTFETKEAALSDSEKGMHNKRQQMHEAYYKEIAKAISNYDHVLLFGPTNAKTELHNFLNEDLHYKDIQIDIVPADKMTDNEKDTFVRNHFKK